MEFSPVRTSGPAPSPRRYILNWRNSSQYFNDQYLFTACKMVFLFSSLTDMSLVLASWCIGWRMSILELLTQLWLHFFVTAGMAALFCLNHSSWSMAVTMETMLWVTHLYSIQVNMVFHLLSHFIHHCSLLGFFFLRSVHICMNYWGFSCLSPAQSNMLSRVVF